MKAMLKMLIPLILGLSACDIGSLMLANGTSGDYVFTNENLEDQFVDESLIEEFTVISTYNGEEALIYGVYVGDQSLLTTDPVIVYCHGNWTDMNNFWKKASKLANVGGQHAYGVVMFDYRGFGLSEGETTNYESMVADYDAVLSWLQARGLTAERTVVYGESLGSIPASHGSVESTVYSAYKVILEAPQSSADAIMNDATGLSMPATTITEIGYDLSSAMAQYDGQLQWLHGTLDEVAPIENAQVVYDSHQGQYKEAHIYENVTHSVLDDIGFETWSGVVEDFILR